MKYMEPFNQPFSHSSAESEKLLLVSCSQAFVKHLISIENELAISTGIVIDEYHTKYRLEAFFRLDDDLTVTQQTPPKACLLCLF